MSLYIKTLFQTLLLLSCMRVKRSPIAWLQMSQPFSSTLSNLARRSSKTSITSLSTILRVRFTMFAVSSFTTSLIVAWFVIFVGALPGLGVLFVLWCYLSKLTENQLVSRYKGTKNNSYMQEKRP